MNLVKSALSYVVGAIALILALSFAVRSCFEIEIIVPRDHPAHPENQKKQQIEKKRSYHPNR